MFLNSKICDISSIDLSNLEIILTFGESGPDVSVKFWIWWSVWSKTSVSIILSNEGSKLSYSVNIVLLFVSGCIVVTQLNDRSTTTLLLSSMNSRETSSTKIPVFCISAVTVPPGIHDNFSSLNGCEGEFLHVITFSITVNLADAVTNLQNNSLASISSGTSKSLRAFIVYVPDLNARNNSTLLCPAHLDLIDIILEIVVEISPCGTPSLTTICKRCL